MMLSPVLVAPVLFAPVLFVGVVLAAPLPGYAAGATATEAGPPTPAAALPFRLSAVVVGNGARRAVFTSLDALSSTTVEEGEPLGSYIVTAIRPGWVQLTGPAGILVLDPAPNPAARARFVAASPIGASPIEASPQAAQIDAARRQAAADNDK